MGQVFTSYSYREVPFQFFWGVGSANLGYSLQVEYTIYSKNIMVNVYILVLYVVVSCVLCTVVSTV